MKITTIPGFAELTPQQAFDLSLAHLRTTRKQNMNDGRCAYSGAGCAAAPFLSADSREAMNGCDSDGNSWGVLVHDNDLSHANYDLIYDLQQIHDSWEPTYQTSYRNDFMAYIETHFREMAERRNLTYKPEATQPGESAM